MKQAWTSSSSSSTRMLGTSWPNTRVMTPQCVLVPASIWGGLPGTLAALAPAVQDAGWIAVGEPYWRTWPLPERAEPDEDEDFLPLPDTMERFHEAGLEVVTLIDASLDDWDRYESLHWLAAEEWLAKHADEPDAEEVQILTQRLRDRYLRWQRELLGWAIIVGRKR
jgi:hypothetical protein